MAALAASAMLPAAPAEGTAGALADDGHWPELDLPPVTAAGYGTDPDLMTPEAPWPLTLTPPQLSLLAVLSDIIVPAEGQSPSASAVQVPTVIDEWVSAPYPAQQRLRHHPVGPGLDRRRSRAALLAAIRVAGHCAQLAIIDDIA